MISFPVLVVTFIVLLILYIYKENLKRPANFPPGPMKLPIFGSYWLILKAHFRYPHKAFVSLGKKFKTDVLGFYVGDFPAITCYKYELLKEVLSREEFTGRPDSCIVRNRGMGNLVGIFFSDGEYWKDQRWFSLRNMRDFGLGRRDVVVEQTVTDEIRSLIEFLMSKPKPCDADVCVKQGVIKMPDLMYAPGFNCIHHILSSTHFEDYAQLRHLGRCANDFLHCIDSTGNCITVAPWLRHIAPEYFGWNTSVSINAPLFQFVKDIIQDHKDTYIEGHPRDFIDLYLAEMKYLEKENKLDSTSFSENQLMYTIVDYMFPAAVAIGHTFASLFAQLINQPDIQVKIQKEIDSVVGRSRLPTIDDRKDLPYTDAALRETIRSIPVVPLGLGRRCTKDTTLGGYFIPENTLILPNIWGMHNDPELWGDPENFRPERWIDDEGKLIADKTFGFGGGKRVCVGETFARNTMFLFFAGIMQNFSLKMPEGKQPLDVTNLENGIALNLPDYWMEVVSRE